MFSRKTDLPPDVKASLKLPRGESVLAATVDDSGTGWLVGSRRALYVGGQDRWTRLPWERIDRATWDRDAEQLEVYEVADFGEVQPRHVRRLAEPGRLLELLHERVTASVVITRHVPLGGSHGLRIVGRRAPGTDEPVVWSAVLDDALDPQDPEVAAAVRQGLAAARAELGATAP
jgi:hypothetical protein